MRYLLVHEDGTLKQADEFSDDDREQVTQGALSVVEKTSSGYNALDPIYNDEAGEWEDYWSAVPEVKA